MDARAATLRAYIATLTDVLAYFDLHCASCHIYTGNKNKNCKSIHECPIAKGMPGHIADYMNWVRTIKYDMKPSQCWHSPSSNLINIRQMCKPTSSRHGRGTFTKWIGAKPAEGRSSNMINLMLWYLDL